MTSLPWEWQEGDGSSHGEGCVQNRGHSSHCPTQTRATCRDPCVHRRTPSWTNLGTIWTVLRDRCYCDAGAPPPTPASWEAVAPRSPAIRVSDRLSHQCLLTGLHMHVEGAPQRALTSGVANGLFSSLACVPPCPPRGARPEPPRSHSHLGAHLTTSSRRGFGLRIVLQRSTLP